MQQNNFQNNDILNADWPVWLFAVFLVWTGLGSYGVLNNNEGLYAQIPMEMLHSGDFRHWIIPHLNGLPYMEKPPLLYWLTALSFYFFGHAEWVVRFVPTLASLACVGLLLYFGRRLNRQKAGRLAAWIFISGLGVLILARTLVFDMVLTAFLTGSLFFAYFYLIEGKKRDLRIASSSLALAVLTKGFVALILFGCVLLAWFYLQYGLKGWKQLRQWLDPIAIGLFFVITCPWLIAASIIEPIFPWFFFINEHVLRFMGLREPHDYYSGAWWYYLPRMILFLFPWSLLVPIALFSRKRVEKEDEQLVRKVLLLGWIIPLVFFSLSSAKANYYIIITMPFAAASLALLLERGEFLIGKKSAILGLLLAIFFCVAATFISLRGEQLLPKLMISQLTATHSPTSHVDLDFSSVELTLFGMTMPTFMPLILWSVGGLSLIAACVAWRIPRVGITAYGIVSLYLMAILIILINALEPRESDKLMAKFIHQSLPNRVVYLYRHFEQNSSLVFYLQKSVNIIDSKSSDLYWGDKLRPGNDIMVGSKEFRLRVNPSVVIVPNAFLSEFREKQLDKQFGHQSSFRELTLFY